MDKKGKIIVFGAGKIFQERKARLQENNHIICILDNNAKDNIFVDGIPVCKPEEIKKLPDVPIIIMSDYFVDMVLQLGIMLGEEMCNRRAIIGRVYVPILPEEHILKNAKTRIIVKNEKAYAVVEENIEVELESNPDSFKKIYREYSKRKDILLQELIKMPLRPIDDSYGIKRGKPIDRYYIEKFLRDKKQNISGDCLEIAENTYTMRYGEERVKNAVILHVEGWGENAIKGNLETGEGIDDDSFDSMIITQTLMCIYDLANTVKNIYRGLKRGGFALITVSAISKISRYDDDNWGYYHSFCRSGLINLFTPVFGAKNVEIINYGNVKAAMMFLYGGTVEELHKEDLDYVDEDYPVIYGILVKKN